MARAGVAARRMCEQMIEAGRVRINGRVVKTLPCFVAPGEEIIVDGVRISRAERRLYVLFNKPARVVSTTRDEPGLERTNIASLVKHPSGTRLYPVGRLEYHATGLVLLTNDGPLAHRLTHARFGVPKVYHATVTGPVTPELLESLERRIARAEKKVGKQEGTLRAPRVSLGIVSTEGERAVVSMTLKDGTATQVAREMLAAGLRVRSVERVGIGPLKLTGVARGHWRELTRLEIREIKAAAKGETIDADSEQRPSKRRVVAASDNAQAEGQATPVGSRRQRARMEGKVRVVKPSEREEARTSRKGAARWQAADRAGGTSASREGERVTPRPSNRAPLSKRRGRLS
jgi:23S rRNA pseudouridine2605 synthase